MKMKMKNSSHRYDIIKPKPKHGHKYANGIISVSVWWCLYVKQHLSNIWRSIHEKVKQRWGGTVKKRYL